MRLMKLLQLVLAVLVLGFGASAIAVEREIDFNRDIRPILSENCFYCHGQDGNKRQADLRLDERDAALKMHAIVPGDVAASEMIKRIRTADADAHMPPVQSNRRLTDAQKQLLEKWIASGAVYEAHWAFQAPVRKPLPQVERVGWLSNPIDTFVLSKLEEAGLTPSPEAERATLVKRLYADLIGLPPEPDVVASFVADKNPNAYEELVDRLLASPRYGERQSLPWLDAARYADSNGFQQDGDTWQWYWRDGLVKSLNDDQPFDEFTIWQLAGDLLPNATVEQKIASGFNRNHLLNGEGGAIAEEQRFVNLFDRIDTTATTWLGLTMACAQCHDHKYDPLTQQDYYGLLDAFNRVPERGTPQRFSSRIRVAAPFIELPTPENEAKIAELNKQIAEVEPQAIRLVDAAYEGWRAGVLTSFKSDGKASDDNGLPSALKDILSKSEEERTDEQKKQLASGLRKHFNEKVRAGLASKFPESSKVDALKKQLADYKADQIPRVMIMSDAEPRESAILDRGEYLKPTTKVTFAPPAFFAPLPSGAPANRLGFAQWLVAPEHALTARVQVNRAWQQFFGIGLVKTSEDFGVQSEYPLHRALLDWLSVEFQQRGWSVKTLHRTIVLSSTYRQSSKVTPELLAADAENRLLARASRFRLPSLVLRDWALATSGLLDARISGAPVYPYQPDAVWEALAITKERDFTYPTSSGGDLYRRSLYTFWRRTVAPADMFDASNRQTCRVRAGVTSTPLHSLTTLNDPAWVEAARVLAERVMRSSDDAGIQLLQAFELVLCRSPREPELAMLNRAYQKQLAIFAADKTAAEAAIKVGASPTASNLDVAAYAAMTNVCLAIYNLDESLTRE